jgi:hypothetical protein
MSTRVRPIHRTRFRFSLRTLFVATTLVALAFGWAMWNVNWIRERHAVLLSGHVAAGDGPFWVPGADGVRSPGALGWFGELGYEYIEVHFERRTDNLLTASDEAELDRVTRLFPEATVVGRVVD